MGIELFGTNDNQVSENQPNSRKGGKSLSFPTNENLFILLNKQAVPHEISFLERRTASTVRSRWEMPLNTVETSLCLQTVFFELCCCYFEQQACWFPMPQNYRRRRNSSLLGEVGGMITFYIWRWCRWETAHKPAICKAFDAADLAWC